MYAFGNGVIYQRGRCRGVSVLGLDTHTRVDAITLETRLSNEGQEHLVTHDTLDARGIVTERLSARGGGRNAVHHHHIKHWVHVFTLFVPREA